MASRRELIAAVGKRYRAGTRAERSRILDDFVRITGYQRKYAIRLLGREPMTKQERRRRPRLYDQAVADSLTVLWEASDRICGKRLKALLPVLITAMQRHGHLNLEPSLEGKLLAVSAATIDRILAGPREQASNGRRRRVGIGSAIRKSVPVRTFADWNEPQPGWFEVDMVEHCGGYKRDGNFVHSLVMTDIATGWTECEALLIREQNLVVNGLAHAGDALPFPMRGIDTDNDSAFMTETLRSFCELRNIEWTRSRAYKKNDQAWVEQKNGAIVRRLVGYGRLSGSGARAALARLYEASRLYVNFFQPCFKLKSKVREGARVRKRYDAPATPFERVLASEAVELAVKAKLREQFASLDPVRLLSHIRQAQMEIAVINEPDTPATDTGGLKTFLDGLSTAWQAGEVRPTHRQRPNSPRRWRTRADPFEQTWPLIEHWLSAEPHATGKELLARLRAAMPEIYPTTAQLRTLQRRILAWRTLQARRLVLGGANTHDQANTEAQSA